MSQAHQHLTPSNTVDVLVPPADPLLLPPAFNQPKPSPRPLSKCVGVAPYGFLAALYQLRLQTHKMALVGWDLCSFLLMPPHSCECAGTHPYTLSNFVGMYPRCLWVGSLILSPHFVCVSTWLQHCSCTFPPSSQAIPTQCQGPFTISQVLSQDPSHHGFNPRFGIASMYMQHWQFSCSAQICSCHTIGQPARCLAPTHSQNMWGYSLRHP